MLATRLSKSHSLTALGGSARDDSRVIVRHERASVALDPAAGLHLSGVKRRAALRKSQISSSLTLPVTTRLLVFPGCSRMDTTGDWCGAAPRTARGRS